MLYLNKGFVNVAHNERCTECFRSSETGIAALHPASNTIPSRRVQIVLNKGKTWLNQIWLLYVVLGCWQWCWHQSAQWWHSGAAFPQMGPVPVGGVGEQDIAHFILGNHVGWGQLYCVCLWIKSPLHNFVLENRGAFQFLSEEISLSDSGCRIWGFWDAFCLMF